MIAEAFVAVFTFLLVVGAAATLCGAIHVCCRVTDYFSELKRKLDLVEEITKSERY